MSLKTAVRDTLLGFKSLLVGMRITASEAAKPIITVQYPHETLKMPDRFRGHIKLILDPESGLSRCTACNLCARACPTECIVVNGEKKPGQKTKYVTDYHLDFTTCSLCGLCIEACPFDAIEFSKEYNAVTRDRGDFENMDLVAQLAREQAAWAQNRPPAPTPALANVAGVAPADVGLAKSATPGAASAKSAAPGPASARPATPTAGGPPPPVAGVAAPAPTSPTPAAPPAAPPPTP